MQTIDEIPVQVPPDIAEVYCRASIEERQQLSMRIGAILRQSFDLPIGSQTSHTAADQTPAK